MAMAVSCTRGVQAPPIASPSTVFLTPEDDAGTPAVALATLLATGPAQRVETAQDAVEHAAKLAAVMSIELATVTPTDDAARMEIERLSAGARDLREAAEILAAEVDADAPLGRRERELVNAAIALRAQWNAFQLRRAADVRAARSALRRDAIAATRP